MSKPEVNNDHADERGNHEVRQRIVSAARSLTAEQGFDASSMRAIVKRAKTSIGNAYFYFENKEALLQAVVEDIVTPIWTYSDQVQQKFPAGAERLGVSIYLNTLPAISGAIPELIIHRGRPDHVMLDALSHALIRRNTEWLPEMMPHLSAGEVAFRIRAILGAGKSIVIGYLKGELSGDAHQICKRLVHWDLQAAGFGADEIESTLNAIKVLRKQDDWPYQILEGGGQHK